MKTTTITIDADTTIDGYGIFPAGTYTVTMPADYDESQVGAVDIVMDYAITLVE